MNTPITTMATAPSLVDGLGRRFPYVRLSVTEICNFRCTYCLPQGYKKSSTEPELSLDEIARMVRGLATMGVWKIRLTGGEPTVRSDILDIIQLTSQTDGIKHVALTTNGYRLVERAQSYKDAGVQSINISVDSLRPEGFKTITGHDRLHHVLEGVEACWAAGIGKVKLNAVLLRGLNDTEIDDFIDFVETRALSMRFIELMRTNDHPAYFEQHHLGAQAVVDRLTARGWFVVPRVEGAGPAKVYAHPNSLGTIGIIAPYSKDFCATCNRLRISSRGALHLCLFGEGGYSLRPWLQRDDQLSELQDRMMTLLGLKRAGHGLHHHDSGANRNFATIGG